MAGRRPNFIATMEPLPNSNDPLRELFEACKVGDIARVRKLVNSQTVNARDTAGRKSTPLHFAAGDFVILKVICNVTFLNLLGNLMKCLCNVTQ